MTFDPPTTYSSAETMADDFDSTAIVFSGISAAGDGTWAGFLESIPVLTTPTSRPGADKLQFDIEFRFTDSGSNGTYFKSNPSATNGIQEIQFPFEVWSVEEDKQIDVALYHIGGGNPLVEEDQDNPGSYKFTINFLLIPIYQDYTGTVLSDYHSNTNMGWGLQFDKNSSRFQPGDIFNIYFRNPLLPGSDVYNITTTAGDYTVTEGDLDEIVVVPNPYNATSVYEHIAFIREVQFMGLPEQCLIRIFNTAGELVQVIKHDVNSPGYRGPSIEAWDLRTYNNQEVSFGVYVFHVISNDQEFTGKLAVIK
jgi:hypothetical protein